MQKFGNMFFMAMPVKINMHQLKWVAFPIIFIAIIAIVVFIILQLGYHLTYSSSASMPRGYYLIIPARSLHRGDIVQFEPPQDAADFILAHHWGPKSGLVLKHIFAIPGDAVCITSFGVWINGDKVAPIYRFYMPGKELPHTKFCDKLGNDQYLLLSTDIERSFDGRYFGPISKNNIIGKAIKIGFF